MQASDFKTPKYVGIVIGFLAMFYTACMLAQQVDELPPNEEFKINLN
jgi:hypothetical protein